MQELDPSIPESVVKTRLSDMVEKGYECAGIYVHNELIGICGIWTLVKYYVGKHIEPDNVYIKAEYRSWGIGKKLDRWLIEFAQSRSCKAFELNCYGNNKEGLYFWDSNDYLKLGYITRKRFYK